MTLNVVSADELQAVIKQTVEETIKEVFNQIKQGKIVEPKEAMNIDELVTYLSQVGVPLTKQTIHTHTHQKTIPHYKLGARLMFRRTEIDKWLDDYVNGRTPKAVGRKRLAAEALAASAAEMVKYSK